MCSAGKVYCTDPVNDVERPVGTEGKEVVRRNALSLARLGYHEQLRQDGDRLQVDAERPHHLNTGGGVRGAVRLGVQRG